MTGQSKTNNLTSKRLQKQVSKKNIRTQQMKQQQSSNQCNRKKLHTTRLDKQIGDKNKRKDELEKLRIDQAKRKIPQQSKDKSGIDLSDDIFTNLFSVFQLEM